MQSQTMRKTEYYEYGNAARDYYYEPERRYEPEERPQPVRRKKTKTAFSMGGLLLSAAAVVIFGAVMLNYVKLQGQLSSKVKTVASKQVELNELQSANDEKYSRIASSVDLAEIEAIARGELGMTYAKEGQVVTYTSAGNDYMRKVDDGN